MGSNYMYTDLCSITSVLRSTESNSNIFFLILEQGSLRTSLVNLVKKIAQPKTNCNISIFGIIQFKGKHICTPYSLSQHLSI